MYSTPDPRRSFRALTSELMLASLISAVADQDPLKKGNNVLVVDDFALSVINAAASTSDILKAGFMAICTFETKKELTAGKRRRKYPVLDALYYMRPKLANLKKIIEDYRQDVEETDKDIMERCFPCLFKGLPQVDVEPPWYDDFRLLVIPGLRTRGALYNWDGASDYLISQATSREKELVRLQQHFITDGPTKECIVQYMAYEANLFSFDMLDTISVTYTHSLTSGMLEGPDLEEVRDKVYDHLDTVAFRLMSALVAMNEYPYIRYVHSDRGIAEVVAKSLAKAMKVYKDSHHEFLPWGDPTARDDDLGGVGSRALRAGEPPEPATVILIDRVDDLGPAVMHDVSYNCLVTDLLEHEPCTPFHYEYTKNGQKVGQDVLLDDNDPVWRLLRYENMGYVADKIDDAIRTSNRRDQERQSLDPKDVNDLRQLMSTLASDEKLVDQKFTQHYRMKDQIVRLFESRNLHDLCTTEQILLTGCDNDGNRVPSKELIRQMRDLMQDNRLTSEDQARLLVILILCHKDIDSKLRNELVGLSHLTKRHQTALLNLVDVKVPIERKASEPKSDSAPFHDEETLKRNKKIAEKTDKLTRYVTKLEDIVHNCIGECLPEDQYPWIRRPPARDKAGRKQVDLTQLNSSQIQYATHGEATNKYAATALAGVAVDKQKIVAVRKTKASKFARDEEATPNDSTGGSGGATPEDDIFMKALEPSKPRVYEGGRLVVFVVGGISQTEICVLEKLSKETNREIIYGGTSLLTARDFLDQLYQTDATIDDQDVGAGIGRNFPAVDEF